MIASWMLYASCVAVLATTAALFFDRAVRDRGRPTRGIWVSMLLSALLWPVIMAVLSDQAASRGTPSRGIGASVLVRSGNKDGIPVTLASRTPPLAGGIALPPVAPASVSANRVALAMLLLTPLLLLSILALDVVRIARSRRRWRREVVDGTVVLVSREFGPAIVGVWQPAIVLPEWALALPRAQRVLLLKHEAEHLARRDGAWIGFAFFALACAPWNVGLWWLMRRLRLAIELDCDQRVLAAGHDITQYGALLLEIGRHRTGGSLLAAGFAERRSMLRVRIETFTGATRRSSRQRGNMLRLGLGSALLVGACSLGPSRNNAPAQEPVVTLGPNVADSIVPDNNQFKPIKAARDLPNAFRVLATEPSGMGMPRARCAMALIDDRDSTELRLRSVTADWKIADSRRANGTASIGSGAVGYYSVVPASRYGVDSKQLLRVGCPAAPIPTNLLASAAPPNLHLGAALERQFGITIDTLARLGTRLDIAFRGDSTDGSHQRAREIARYAWDQLGAGAADLDTITVMIVPPKGREIEFHGRTLTWIFYPTARDLGP